jgi:hypothetical protein
MRKPLSLTAALCALVAASCVLSAGPADAAGLSPVVADCNTHTHLTQHYSITQLRSALAGMPADIREYTNCPDVIQRALLAELGSPSGGGAGGGSGSGGGSFLPTPLIVVLGLLVVGGAAFGAVAWRRRK